MSLILIFSGSKVFMLLYPLILTISSTISIGSVMSGLQVGIFNSNSCFFLDISKPKLVKIFTMSLSFILNQQFFQTEKV